MIDVSEAHEIIRQIVQPLPVVRVPIGDALWRTLAEPIRCDVDDPPFDRALMDGYAVRAADVIEAPATLRVVGQVAAGAQPQRSVQRGEAIQINTGAPIPSGADAVVPVENTEPGASENHVLIKAAVSAGMFIAGRGTHASAGQTVLDTGTRLGPAEIGVVATCGLIIVEVYRRPRVAVLVTGDELVAIDRVPTGGQIRNANQYILEALIDSAHAEAVVLGVAGDNREGLREKVTEGLGCDVLCITGGVSMGAFDFVPEVLADLGAKFHIRKMAIKPGKPNHFATMPKGTLVFALPGNPVSAFVGFELLVRPALAGLEGRPGAVPTPMRARLTGRVKPTGDRRSYLPGRVRVNEHGECEVQALSWHGSGDAFGLATANALIVRSARAGAAESGDFVSIILLDRV